jgi:hypothetical protein
MDSMNIYEDERLEKQFKVITDQIGHLLLDLIAVSLMKVNAESQIFKDFEETRSDSFTEDPEF